MRPPPSDVRAVGRRGPGKEGGTVGVGSGYKLSRPEASASGSTVYTTPPDPPPIPHHAAPDFRTSLSRDVRKSGAGGRRRGKGLGTHHCGGLGGAGFDPPRLYAARLGSVAQAEAKRGIKSLT